MRAIRSHVVSWFQVKGASIEPLCYATSFRRHQLICVRALQPGDFVSKERANFLLGQGCLFANLSGSCVCLRALGRGLHIRSVLRMRNACTRSHSVEIKGEEEDRKYHEATTFKMACVPLNTRCCTCSGFRHARSSTSDALSVRSHRQEHHCNGEYQRSDRGRHPSKRRASILVVRALGWSSSALSQCPHLQRVRSQCRRVPARSRAGCSGEPRVGHMATFELTLLEDGPLPSLPSSRKDPREPMQAKPSPSQRALPSIIRRSRAQ